MMDEVFAPAENDILARVYGDTSKFPQEASYEGYFKTGQIGP
jgi:hypothetical protein